MATTNDRSTGELTHDPRVLLGPGPSNLHPHVFRAMASPILGYLDPDFLAIMDHTMAPLRYLFQTEDEHRSSTSPTERPGMKDTTQTLSANTSHPELSRSRVGGGREGGWRP